MSRKHNTRHNRSRSNYPERLSARGLGKSPKMPALESLQSLHRRRVVNNGSPFPPAVSEEHLARADELAEEAS